MAIEVEQKFHVSLVASLERKLAALGAVHQETMTQVDRYLAHPARDFSRTDEALRLRQVGQLNFMTYKGPKLDNTTKTRREIEIALADGQKSASDAIEMLEALGFRRVADVRKRRKHFSLQRPDWQIGVSLDDVEGLGNFLELEILVGEADVAQAREALASLAAELELGPGERQSYLELLLARRPP
jgi:adenylate cyclase class 2